MWMKWCQVILCHKTWQSWQGQIKDAHHARYNSYLNPRQKWGYFGVVPGSRVHCRLGCSTYCSLPRYLCFPVGSLCGACGIWRFYKYCSTFSLTNIWNGAFHIRNGSGVGESQSICSGPLLSQLFLFMDYLPNTEHKIVWFSTFAFSWFMGQGCLLLWCTLSLHEFWFCLGSSISAVHNGLCSGQFFKLLKFIPV